jgi:hypothetical protein
MPAPQQDRNLMQTILEERIHKEGEIVPQGSG